MSDCFPIKIDFRQKNDKYDWKVTGNIFLHQISNKWIYGIPDRINGIADFQIFCFDELQSEVFPMGKITCTQMEKRFCCSDEKTPRTTRMNRLFTDIEPPKLSEIYWTDLFISPPINTTTTPTITTCAGEFCSVNGYCAPSGCKCNLGYVGDGVTCSDLNECELNVCREDELCLNIEGSYLCACPWKSIDVPTGDGGTGDHELTTNIDPCEDGSEPYHIEVREKSYQLPYYIRNVIFHKRGQNYFLGPSREYGFRLVEIEIT